MGVRILYDNSDNLAALYCSTSDVAFGPVFTGDRADGHDADERAEAFLRWVHETPTWTRYEHATTIFTGHGRDVRVLSESGLQSAYSDWLAQEAAQWQTEAAKETEETDA